MIASLIAMAAILKSQSISIADLDGKWIVRSNKLVSSDVQAYFVNDRSVVGHYLIVTSRSVEWKPKRGRAFLDVCYSPSVVGVKSSFDLSCENSTRFGPYVAGDPSLSLLSPNRLTLKWYDGLILDLTRGKRTEQHQRSKSH